MANRAGWGEEPFPEIYHIAEGIAQTLRAEARQVNDNLFSIETRLRGVRLASTPEQRQLAVKALTAAVAFRLVSIPVLPTERETQPTWG